MNQTIAGIVDLLFKDTMITEETNALHEELMNNCQEHYVDLVKHGFSEAEAIDAVIESLKGMKEVIDQYPKKETEKQETFPEEKTAEPIWEDQVREEEPDTDRRHQIYPSAEIRSIRVNVKSQDIHVTRSVDSFVHIRCDQPDTIDCRLNGSVLSVEAVSEPVQKKVEWQNEELSLQGIFRFIGKTIQNLSSIVGDSCPVYVELPENGLAEIQLTTKSGDVFLDQVQADTISVRSASGDLSLMTETAGVTHRFTAETTSGDVDVRGDMEEALMSSISGDISLYGGANRVRLKSVSGDVRMEGSLEKVDLHSVSGDIDLILVDGRAKQVDLNTISGDIDIDLPEDFPFRAKCQSRSGSVHVRESGTGDEAACLINASTVSGDVTVS